MKTIRKTETSFAGYDETKKQQGKRDHAKEEIFLRQNRVALEDLPLEEINELWLKSHLPSLKKISKRDVWPMLCPDSDASRLGMFFA